MQETWVQTLIPWRRKWQPTPAFLSGKSHGQRSLAGCSPWGCRRVGHDLATEEHIHVYMETCIWLPWISAAALRLPLAAAFRLLTAVTSLVSEHGLWGVQTSGVVVHGLSYPAACVISPDQGSCLCPLALASGPLTSGTQGKSLTF